MDAAILSQIHLAVREDLGGGDQTARLAIDEHLRGTGTMVARRGGTISGTFLLPAILREYDATLSCRVVAPDGSRVTPRQPVAVIEGPARGLLSAERVLLNFLGHLSGIATMTRRYVDALAHLPENQRPAICDTRKTTPGFRALDKYAVRCGGGVNHRLGLYDGVMLKDNHLAALREKLGAGLSLAQLTVKIRTQLDPAITLWLEVDTLDQLRDALPTDGCKGADIILLDNFSPGQMRQAVELRNSTQSKILLEASGGITLDNLVACAHSGVERISVGALTHSAPVLDLSMELA